MDVSSALVPDLLATARYGSSSPLLAQASGGNNSVKDASRDLLWIKASGVRLRDVGPHCGTVALRCSTVREHIGRETRQRNRSGADWKRERHEHSVQFLQKAVLDPTEGRPSLETGFHALLGKVVLHLHPVYLNAFTCMQGGLDVLSHVGPREFKWVKYATPGRELAVEVNRIVSCDQGTDILCLALENHGFVASGATAVEVTAATDDFVLAGRSFFGEFPPELIVKQSPSPDAEQTAELFHSCVRERWGGLEHSIRPASFRAFTVFARQPEFFTAPGALVPDDVVYAGGGIQFCTLEGLREWVWNLPEQAPQKIAVAVEDVGTLLFSQDARLLAAMEEILLAHVLVRLLIARRGKVLILPEHEVAYLGAMESEKYRIRVSASGAS